MNCKEDSHAETAEEGNLHLQEEWQSRETLVVVELNIEFKQNKSYTVN